jgi:nickel/cobalt transporter (NicO) family protein
MRKVTAVFTLSGVVALITLFWISGGVGWVQAQALAGQREFQTALARALQALRAGHPGALAGLLGVSFAYGFFHAVGPGHGKVLIASYGVGRQVPLLRLMIVALASSLGQAVTAIIAVYGTLWLLGWGRAELTNLADITLARIGAFGMAAIGFWLIWRGLRKLVGKSGNHHEHHHDHTHDHHGHLPDAETVLKKRGLGETLAMILAIAIRPCTGALLLLLLTWQLDLAFAGILGAFAMALGTASVVLVVAVLAGGAASGLLTTISEGWAAKVALPLLEITAGLVIACAAILSVGWI